MNILSNAVQGVKSADALNGSLNASKGVKPPIQLSKNLVSNMQAASNGCPVVSECKNMV